MHKSGIKLMLADNTIFLSSYNDSNGSKSWRQYFYL